MTFPPAAAVITRLKFAGTRLAIGYPPPLAHDAGWRSTSNVLRIGTNYTTSRGDAVLRLSYNLCDPPEYPLCERQQPGEAGNEQRKPDRRRAHVLDAADLG